MAGKAASKSTTVVLENIPIEVRPLKLKKSPALAWLDVDKLAKAGKAEFEYGTVTVGKFKRTVNALVKKGMVVGLEIADCDDCRNDELPVSLKKAFDRIATKLNGGKPSSPVPVPVSVFLREEPPIGRSHCTMFCIFGYCFICCSCCSLTIGCCTVLGGDLLKAA
jgi:hypothetical protein